MAMSEPALLEEARKVASVIDTARRLLGEDKMIDLSALEGKVMALCANVEAARPAGGSPVRRALDAILADIGQLSEELMAQHRKMSGVASADALDAYHKSKDKS